MTYLIVAFCKLAEALKSYVDAFLKYIINGNLKQFVSLHGTLWYARKHIKRLEYADISGLNDT